MGWGRAGALTKTSKYGENCVLRPARTREASRGRQLTFYGVPALAALIYVASGVPHPTPRL